MNKYSPKSNSLQKGEIAGSFLLGLSHAFTENNLISQDTFPFNPNEILPQEWYPFNYFFETIEVINREIPNAKNILFWAGVNFFNIWYYHGPGKGLISCGLDWIYANSDSGGYNSVVRGGSPDEIGWSRITDMDVDKGYVVYENFNPFQSEFLRGLFYAGCILFNDMEYVTIETIENPHKSKGYIVYTTITINFRLKKNQDLDDKIEDLNLKTPTIHLSEVESQSLAWQIKGLQYHTKLLKSHQEELSKLLGINLFNIRKNAKKLQNYISLVDTYISISTTDLDGNILDVSEAFCELCGYSKNELIGRNHRILRHPDMNPEIYKQLWETILSNKSWKGELKSKRKNGDFYWTQTIVSPIFNEIGEKIAYTAIIQDMTDKKAIEEISILDGLTGIYNRRHFNEVLPKVINNAKRKNELVHFIMIDIDYFKRYNDNYGHPMGDNVLIQVAKALKDSVNRSDDYCFRLGGEEFGILFKAKSNKQSIIFADIIRKNIEDLHILHSGNSASPYVTASLGLISQEANDILSTDEIYKQADELLYKAKEAGRNRVSFGNY
jgi:diguanylate cyclase (GGDEF)-like protein/PAS domain S-box-containing protein